MKMRLVIFLVAIAVFCWSGILLAFKYNRTVKPIKNKEDAVFTMTLYGLSPHDNLTQKLVYTSYVAGFMDAMQLQQVDPSIARKFAKKYNGMTLGDIVNAMGSFYDNNPGYRKEKPVDIILGRIKGRVPEPDNQAARGEK